MVQTGHGLRLGLWGLSVGLGTGQDGGDGAGALSWELDPWVAGRAMPRLCIYSCVLGPHGGSPRGQGDRDQAVFTGAAIYFLMQSKWVQELEPVRASVTGKMDTEATKMGTVQCREDTFRVSEQV